MPIIEIIEMMTLCGEFIALYHIYLRPHFRSFFVRPEIDIIYGHTITLDLLLLNLLSVIL